MRIQPIVEGHGEVQAVPVLLRRLLDEAQVFDRHIFPPIRRKRSEFEDESPLRKAIQLALLSNCSAILVLFDGDDSCPREHGPRVQRWAQDQAGEVPCVVVMAWREYEAWFLATMESLRNQRGVRADAVSHPDPETPRDAKGVLEDSLEPGLSYFERADQPAFSASFDLGLAFRRTRSFRRMVSALGALMSRHGVLPATWPPESWRT